MMDMEASLASTSFLENKTQKNIFEENVKEYSSSTTEEEEEVSSYNNHFSETNERRPLKRNIEDDYYYNKKRRKQLKPNKIASTDDTIDMVKVPNATISELSKSVPPKNVEKSPNRNRSPLKDVYIHNDSETLGEENIGDSPSVSSPINVPKLPLGPILNTNFMFPFTAPDFLTSPNYWQDKVRIFNQEAYCELCKKEFCNKYFLKTHKANKHGIVLDINKKDADEIPTNVENEMDDKIKAFCDVCNRRFCNKYFVRRHKTKTHGFAATEDSSGATSDAGNSEEEKHEENGVKNDDNQKDEDEQKSPLNLIVNDYNNFEDSDESIKEDECSTENLEKLQTMLLRLNPSEMENKEFFDKDEDSLDEQKEPEFFINKMEDLKQKSQPTSSYCEICNKELCNKYFMRTHMQRMHGIEIEHGTQIGGVVCNICNKELCSKYFLRVHKQNTHGVASPGAAPSTSTCQSSPKESGNDKFYSNFTQVCFICSRRFRSPKWLQAHLLSDHREEITKQEEQQRDGTLKIPRHDKMSSTSVVSKLFWENSSAAATYSCSQCNFTTPVLAFLFVHERSHFVFNLQNQDKSQQSKSFWQQKVVEGNDCLDLSMKSVSVERKGS